LALSLIAAPSYAVTLTTEGGMAPCGEQMCVDVEWSWLGDLQFHGEPNPSAEATLVLPLPDTASWELSSGSVTNTGGSVAFEGWFDPLGIEQFWAERGHVTIGQITSEFLVQGANGGTLAKVWGFPMLAYCQPEEPPFPDPTRCSDNYGTAVSFNYTAVPGDPAFDGPLTLRYDYHTDLALEPLSATYRVEYFGAVHLIYNPVPEPSTGLLVMTGLLGLADRQRRHRRV
jgi:hypothetical protein